MAPLINHSENKKFNFFYSFIAVFVVALQIQWDFTLLGGELRVGVSDLLLPFFIVGIAIQEIFYKKTKPHTLISLFNPFLNFFKKSDASSFSSYTWLPAWIVLFTLWMGVSLLKPWFETGQLSSWGLINKFMGWFLLMGYFWLGKYLVEQDISTINNNNNQKSTSGEYLFVKQKKNFLEAILKALFISGGIINLGSLLFGLFYHYFPQAVFIDDSGRLIGFQTNANTYGLFLAFTFLLQVPMLSKSKLFSNYVHTILLSLNFYALLLSSSRGALIAFAISFSVLVVFRMINFKNAKYLLLCIMLITLTNITLKLNANRYLLHRVATVTQFDHSIAERVQSNKFALGLWLEKPFTGIGLGSFIEKQKDVKVPDMPLMPIHNTIIWFLTETGLIGLLLFSFFVYKVIEDLIIRIKADPEDIFAKSLISIIVCFFVVSMGMEVIYQRYFWFFLGLILFMKCNRSRVGVQEHTRTEGLSVSPV